MKNFVLFAALAWLALFPRMVSTRPIGSGSAPSRCRPARPATCTAVGVTRLYWHAGTVKWDGSAWHWIERLRLDWPALRASCPDVVVVPVLRIEAGKVETFPAPSRAPLAQILNQLVAQAGANALEIDYESPDRLISEYADFLHQLKDQGRPWRYPSAPSVIGPDLPRNWPPAPTKSRPCSTISIPDSSASCAQGLPPLVEPAMADQLAAWRGCPIPWRAGLPNFSRVTVVDSSGKSRGNLRAWSWSDLLFAPQLQPLGLTADGQTVFTVTRDFDLGRTPLKAQEHLAVRYPDRAALQQAQAAATADGAQGVVYFRLADSADPSGYSVRDLADPDATPPALAVTRDAEGRFVPHQSRRTRPDATRLRLRARARGRHTDLARGGRRRFRQGHLGRCRGRHGTRRGPPAILVCPSPGGE